MSWMRWSEVKKTCKDCVRDGGGARSIKKYLINMIYYIVRLTLCELLAGHCHWTTRFVRYISNGVRNEAASVWFWFFVKYAKEVGKGIGDNE